MYQQPLLSLRKGKSTNGPQLKGKSRMPSAMVRDKQNSRTSHLMNYLNITSVRNMGRGKEGDQPSRGYEAVMIDTLVCKVV